MGSNPTGGFSCVTIELRSPCHDAPRSCAVPYSAAARGAAPLLRWGGARALRSAPPPRPESGQRGLARSGHLSIGGRFGPHWATAAALRRAQAARRTLLLHSGSAPLPSYGKRGPHKRRSQWVRQIAPYSKAASPSDRRLARGTCWAAAAAQALRGLI